MKFMGTKCAICGEQFTPVSGMPMFFFNGLLMEFCGAECSTKWWALVTSAGSGNSRIFIFTESDKAVK